MAAIEVKNPEETRPVDFKYKNEGPIMCHNYYCAVCKEHPGVQDLSSGILQPCWGCQNKYRVVKLTWISRIFIKVC